MVTPDITPPGAPCWIELTTADTRQTRSFYRRLFGWSAEEPALDNGGYFLFRGAPPYWKVYFAVEDTDRTLDTITRLGGTALDAPRDTPHGRLAAAADPSGASFKLVANS